MRTLALLLLVSAGCGGTQRLEERPKGRSEHIAMARSHEARAAEHAEAAARAEVAPTTPDNYTCGDAVLNDQLTSGTERLTAWVPCIDRTWEAELAHRAAAEDERARAREERAIASGLLTREQALCAGVPEDQIARSAFSTGAEVVAVTPHRAGEQIRGARIVIEPTPGMTAASLHRTIACHQARFATQGQPATFLAEDPTVVEGAKVTVREHQQRLEIDVTTDAPGAGQIVLARARDLTTARTATR